MKTKKIDEKSRQPEMASERMRILIRKFGLSSMAMCSRYYLGRPEVRLESPGAPQTAARAFVGGPHGFHCGSASLGPPREPRNAPD